MKQFHDIMEDKQEHANLSLIADEINKIVQGTLSINQFPFLPSLSLSSNDLHNYSNGWRNYLENNSWIKSIIDDSTIDPIV